MKEKTNYIAPATEIIEIQSEKRFLDGSINASRSAYELGVEDEVWQ